MVLIIRECDELKDNKQVEPFSGRPGKLPLKADNGSVPDGCWMASITHPAWKWCCSWAQLGHFHPLACLTSLMYSCLTSTCTPHSEHPGVGKSTLRQSGATAAVLLFVWSCEDSFNMSLRGPLVLWQLISSYPDTISLSYSVYLDVYWWVSLQ